MHEISPIPWIMEWEIKCEQFRHWLHLASNFARVSRAKERGYARANTMEHCLRGKCRHRGMQIRPWNWETIGLKLYEYVGSSWISLWRREQLSRVMSSLRFLSRRGWNSRANCWRRGNVRDDFSKKPARRNYAMMISNATKFKRRTNECKCWKREMK